MGDVIPIEKPVHVWYVKDAFGYEFYIRCEKSKITDEVAAFYFGDDMIAQFCDYSSLVKCHEDMFPKSSVN